MLPDGAIVVTPPERLGDDDIYLAIRLIYGEDKYVVLRGNGALEVYDASEDDSFSWKRVGSLAAEQ